MLRRCGLEVELGAQSESIVVVEYIIEEVETSEFCNSFGKFYLC